MMALSGCAVTPDPVPPAPAVDAPAVVFDIDGTLTPDVHAIFSVRDGAAESVTRFADAGVQVVYLTGRVRALQFLVPGWLDDHDFPEGSLQLRTFSSPDDQAEYKARVLRDFNERGWRILAAFGETASDFEAYDAAGVPRDRVFALRREGEDECQGGVWRSCHGDWNELAPVIDALLELAGEKNALR